LEDISTRDRTGIQKTFSGLMKILFPHQEATAAEIEELLRFAIEGRKRVKDQLMRIDTTYTPVRFGYRVLGSGEVKFVKTLEEEQYPKFYHRAGTEDIREDAEEITSPQAQAAVTVSDELQTGHRVIKENQRGVSFDALFGAYVRGAKRIEITDPYLRHFYQIRNLMELLETVVKFQEDGEETAVHVVTIQDEFGENQMEYFQRIERACEAVGIQFSVSFDLDGQIHARHIVTDHGWKISLDRGLDVFQRYEMNDAFDFANRVQGKRPCKGFEVTYLRLDT